ncbi:cytochrome b/b6 domain-containing protein [Methylosinus sp. Sm6]|uniref:cytochrome b/b6 domain-containing protein n=1 Tax=Methylosinus sp. Sm6 TaxID=2866948 RepID=UPI001C996D0F|nr:cytochrome b/b6 domain-containing protein [Methylosinus sp. Sm6]MBY6242241.1 cytochrome b/b6 domain-containing protein [Methylosinus sp. Sm6]
MTIIDEQRPQAQSAAEAPPRTTRLVWDLPVRLVHWSLVISFVGAFITNKLGVAWFDWHVRFGYGVLALVAFRILWGFFGTKHARFASFVTPLGETLRYLRRLARGAPTAYAGHNPLGALMVVALLLGLGAQAGLGLFSDDEIFNAGPFAGLIGKETSLALTSLHARGFYLLAAAVAAHVAAVLAHVFIKRDNLVRAMITGRKAAHKVPAQDEIAHSRLVAAMALVLVVAAVFAVASSFVPVAEANADAF